MTDCLFSRPVLLTLPTNSQRNGRRGIGRHEAERLLKGCVQLACQVLHVDMNCDKSVSRQPLIQIFTLRRRSMFLRSLVTALTRNVTLNTSHRVIINSTEKRLRAFSRRLRDVCFCIPPPPLEIMRHKFLQLGCFGLLQRLRLCRKLGKLALHIYTRGRLQRRPGRGMLVNWTQRE